MSIQAKLYVGDHEFNVLECHFSFKKAQDSVGRPSGHTLFKGVNLLLEGTKSNLFWEWAIHPTEKKQAELHFTPRLLGTKTRRLQLIDAYCIEQRVNFLNHSATPITETVVLTCGGFKDANFEAEYSAHWRETFPIDKSAEVITQHTINEPEPVQDIDFVKGWWSNDKAGKELLKKAKLGDTVFFHVEVKGLADGQKITLKLAEYDYYLFLDYLDPDDRKFPENEVVKETVVNHGKAVVDLVLQNSWEVMIKDDSDELGNLDSTLELYWDVSYKNHKKTLPKKKDDYLRVDFNDRTLYFKTPHPEHNLPEFISYNGDPLFLMQFAIGFTIDNAGKKLLDKGTSLANKKIDKIAFTKMEKGYMVSNTGEVFKGKRLIYEYKKMYSNSGELFENVKQGKNFGYNHGNGLVTTKGLSQYDYFSKQGTRVKLLGTIGKISGFWDIFNVGKSAMSSLDTSEPIPLDFGVLSPIANLAGVLVQEQKAESDTFLESDLQLEIDIAKLEGLDTVRQLIQTWNHHELFTWELMAVSKETAIKLLKGEFETFYELEDFNRRDMEEADYSEIEILFKEVFNENREQSVFIIETIFINE